MEEMRLGFRLLPEFAEMMISAENNTTRKHQKAQGQGQGLAAGYDGEYIKFYSNGGGERSSFCVLGTQPESILNHQP